MKRVAASEHAHVLLVWPEGLEADGAGARGGRGRSCAAGQQPGPLACLLEDPRSVGHRRVFCSGLGSFLSRCDCAHSGHEQSCLANAPGPRLGEPLRGVRAGGVHLAQALRAAPGRRDGRGAHARGLGFVAHAFDIARVIATHCNRKHALLPQLPDPPAGGEERALAYPSGNCLFTSAFNLQDVRAPHRRRQKRSLAQLLRALPSGSHHALADAAGGRSVALALNLLGITAVYCHGKN
mmetsp:Transcript_70120/g.216855  ORF Transcript_70120/g.216855 Transcript_70120/m.216855 type:complete len:238 (-) Transcript_70120:490-1203(-)